jgi:hypothetical protein
VIKYNIIMSIKRLILLTLLFNIGCSETTVSSSPDSTLDLIEFEGTGEDTSEDLNDLSEPSDLGDLTSTDTEELGTGSDLPSGDQQEDLMDMGQDLSQETDLLNEDQHTSMDAADINTEETLDLAPEPTPLPLCINEFMPQNNTTLEVDAATPDWIELHNPTDADVLLDGWTITDDKDIPDMHLLAGGLSVPPGGFLLLYPDSLPELGPEHLSFSLDVEGDDVALFAPDGQGSIVNYGTVDGDIAVARRWDCCDEPLCWEFLFSGTPGTSNGIPPTLESTLIPTGSLWQYNDTGESLPDNWNTDEFDASAWPEGAAPLGFGDDYIVTEISYGDDELNKHITTYFRRTLETDDPSEIIQLVMGVLFDDGVVIHLNGDEIMRLNMSSGFIDPDDLASIPVDSETEGLYTEFFIVPELLESGTNILSGEVHQITTNSSDLGFDLYVTATILQ